MLHVEYQEKFWGYRYIERSFSDRFRFGPSADIGLDIIYKLRDLVSFDIILSNGEGYTNIQNDRKRKTAFGFIFSR